MTLTITLQADIEERFREEAASYGLTPEQLVARRLLEAELLWRILTATPEPETHQLHRLLRKRKSKPLTDAEQTRLQSLLNEREERGAQRLQDLALLSHLRGMPVRQLMEHLGIHPLATP
jgi:hypothetical protein